MLKHFYVITVGYSIQRNSIVERAPMAFYHHAYLYPYRFIEEGEWCGWVIRRHQSDFIKVYSRFEQPWWCAWKKGKTLQWCHNECDGVSNYRPHDCLLKHVFKAKIKANIKAPRYWPLCGEFTGDRWIPHTNWPVMRKMFPFDDVIMKNTFIHTHITWMHCMVCGSIYDYSNSVSIRFYEVKNWIMGWMPWYICHNEQTSESEVADWEALIFQTSNMASALVRTTCLPVRSESRSIVQLLSARPLDE